MPENREEGGAMIKKTIQRGAARTPVRPRGAAPVLAIAAVSAAVLVVWATAPGPADAVWLHPRGLSGYEIVTAVTEASLYNVQSASARCSRGKKVLGGGASILGSSGAAVFWNGPARTRGTGSWTAAAQEITSTAGPWSLEVYAICAYGSAARREE